MSRAGMRRGTRAALGAQVALAVVLALAAAVLATEVADWRYLRVDLSEAGRNTVDPATDARLGNLSGELEVHTFLEPLAEPYRALSGEALARVVDLLYLVENAHRGKVSVVHHDMGDPAAAAREQMELGVEGHNVVVLRHGARTAVVRVFGEGVAVDWGNPTEQMVAYLTERGIPNVVDPRTWNPRTFEPARITGFPFESAFAAAVARVSVEREPRAYASTGHGEAAIDGTTTAAISDLAGALERDGFRVAPWDGREGGVPDDCELLLVVGPRQPLGAREREAVRAYVAGGGRLVVAPSAQAPGAAAPLLADHGIELLPGVVCEEIRAATGELVEGHPYCAVLKVDGRTMAHDHPVTDLMRRNGLRLEFSNALSFDRGELPREGEYRPLVRSTREAWRDLPDPARGGHDYALEQARGERKGPATLIALVELEPGRAAAAADAPRGRVLAIGAASFLADGAFRHNRDFHRAMMNWMVEREHRVDVAPRAADTSAIDVTRGREQAILAWTFLLGLPGLCALCGLVVGWRRRRG